MRVALAQVASGPDPAANLALVEGQARRAAGAGASLVVFPEATMCSFARASSEIAEPADGPWAGRVRELAGELGITIVVGTFVTADGGRVRNRLLVTGAAETHYDKIHLFDALGFRESEHIEPGAEPVVAEVDGVGLGLAVCYDVRFPGLFTTLAGRGADVIVVAASWAPGPGKISQWTTLARARAMDSTSFVLAVGQACGGDPEVESRPTGVGHSLAVDPTGRVLLELGEAPELAVLDLDPSVVAGVRTRLPLLRDSRGW